MKLKLRLFLILAISVLGITLINPISNVSANTQASQQIKFNLKIDKTIDKEDPDDTTDVPNEQVIRVKKYGTLVIDASDEKIRYVYINEYQMNHLINQEAFIKIMKGDIILIIPAKNFTGKRALTLIFEPVVKGIPSIDKALTKVYDYTLKWGNEIVSIFKYPITLQFRVSNHDNPNELKIYYWNEKTEEWEVVGGQYKNGYVNVNTQHFSIFALFHPKDLLNQSGTNRDENVVGPNKKKDNSNRGISLPKTSTNTFNFIVLGFTLLILGLFQLVNYRRKIGER